MSGALNCRPGSRLGGGGDEVVLWPAHHPLRTCSFVDFLSLYGGFAGEDLEEEDEEEDEDEDDLGGADDLEQQRGIPGPSPSNGKPAGASGVTERSPLLRRGKSSKSVSGGEAGHGAGGAGGRKRSHSTTKTGDATVTQAILMVCLLRFSSDLRAVGRDAGH